MAVVPVVDQDLHFGVRAELPPTAREHEQIARLLTRRFYAMTIEERIDLAEVLDVEGRSRQQYALDLVLSRYPAVAEMFEQRQFEASLGGGL